MYLCQLSGIPGSGKSTLAKHIVKTTHTIILDLDTIKSSILTSLSNEIDFSTAGKVAYDLIFTLADFHLSMGASVIIDSPCAYDVILERGIAIAEKYHAMYKFIECQLLDIAALNRRRTERVSMPSQVYSIAIDEPEFERQMKTMKRPTRHEYLIVDTSFEIGSFINSVIIYLNR